MFIILIFQAVFCLFIGGSPVLAVEARTHDANRNMTLMPGLKGKYDAWNRLVEVKDSEYAGTALVKCSTVQPKEVRSTLSLPK